MFFVFSPNFVMGAPNCKVMLVLQRPKRKPLREYFIDEEEDLQAPEPDPNAPKPEGSTIAPTQGEQLIVSAKRSSHQHWLCFIIMCLFWLVYIDMKFVFFSV